MSSLEIDPDVLGRLRRFQELPTRCTLVASSGVYVIDRIRTIDDPEEAPSPWRAYAALDCRDGKTHRIPLFHIHSVKAIRPSG